VTDKTRTKIAAIITTLFLGAICAAGLTMHATTQPLTAAPTVTATQSGQAPTTGRQPPVVTVREQND
jgi:hypothetical protein